MNAPPISSTSDSNILPTMQNRKPVQAPEPGQTLEIEMQGVRLAIHVSTESGQTEGGAPTIAVEARGPANNDRGATAPAIYEPEPVEPVIFSNKPTIRTQSSRGRATRHGSRRNARSRRSRRRDPLAGVKAVASWLWVIVLLAVALFLGSMLKTRLEDRSITNQKAAEIQVDRIIEATRSSR